ncbi:MAG TPA: hypothetical protein VI299_27915 [Polyangiales bacterium]
MPSKHQLLLLAVASLFLLHALLFLGGIIDDAYISFRYARNLVEGHGLVFNEGERVEGFTNFSWTMLAALSLALYVPPTITLPLVGVVAGVALVLAAGRAASALAPRAPALSSACAAGLVACTTGIAFYAVSGLEETFFTLLITLASLGLIARRVGSFAAWTTLAFLTRPEAGLLGAAGTLLFALDVQRAPPGEARKRASAALLRVLAAFAVLLAPYLAFKAWYFGGLVPNTLRAKTPEPLLAVRYTAEGVWPVAAIVAFCAVPRVWATLARPQRELLAMWLLYVAAVLMIGPDWMPAYRYLLPATPLLAIASAEPLSRALCERGSRAWLAGGALALALVANVARTAQLAESTRTWQQRDELSRRLARDLVAGGARSIATINIGLLGWGAPSLRLLDLAGLVDTTIGKSPGGHLSKRPPDAYLLERAPDVYVLTSSQPALSEGRGSYVPDTRVERYIFERPWFGQCYEYAGSVQFFTQHFYHLFQRKRASGQDAARATAMSACQR